MEIYPWTTSWKQLFYCYASDKTRPLYSGVGKGDSRCFCVVLAYILSKYCPYHKKKVTVIYFQLFLSSDTGSTWGKLFNYRREWYLFCPNTMSQCCWLLFPQKLSRGVKWSLCVFTLAETVVSLVLCGLLFKRRHNFAQYNVKMIFFKQLLFINAEEPLVHVAFTCFWVHSMRCADDFLFF